MAVALLSLALPEGIGVDWLNVYRPASLELLKTGNPFRVEGFFNAPWALLPLIPLALLPERLGYAAFTVTSLIAFGLAAYRFKARPLVFGAFLVSPPVLHSLVNGGIDWLPLIGFVLPPQIGLFLALVKPQMSIVVIPFWLVETWRTGGIRQVFKVFAPVTLALVLSFVAYGLWPLRFGQEVSLWWNASLWPTSIPVGLALAVAAVRQRKLELAMGASPCLSPYVLFHSWSGALAALLQSPLEFYAAWIGLWILVAIQATHLIL